MNDKGNKYALAALKDKRASLASEIAQLESQLRHRRDSLMHVDACLRLLDPSIAPDKIPRKRLLPQRVRLFRQGELNRAIRDALRQGKGQPMTTAEIVTSVMAAKGHGEEARAALAPRVRGNLAYLQRREVVVKSGDQRTTRWRLA